MCIQKVETSKSASNTTRLSELTFLILIMAGTVVVGIVNFASATNFPDSEKYLLLVDFLLGKIPASRTISPFNARVLLPFLVSITYLLLGKMVAIPLIFAIHNVLFLTATTYVFYKLLHHLGVPTMAARLVAMSTVFTWHYGWYGTAVLVEGPAIFFYLLSVYLLLTRSHERWYPYLQLVVLILGVLSKETTLILIPIILYCLFFQEARKLQKEKLASHETMTQTTGALSRWIHVFKVVVKRNFLPWLLIVIIPPTTYLSVRIFFYLHEGRVYVWLFNLNNFLHLITYITIFLELAQLIILGGLLLYLLQRLSSDHPRVIHHLATLPRQDPLFKDFLVSSTLVTSLYLVYAFFFAYFDGRFFWQLYYSVVLMLLILISRRLLQSQSTTSETSSPATLND